MTQFPQVEFKRGYLELEKSGLGWYWYVAGTGRKITNMHGWHLTRRGAIRAGTRCINRREKRWKRTRERERIYV